MGIIRDIILGWLFPEQSNWKHIMVKTDDVDSIRQAIRKLAALLPEDERKKKHAPILADIQYALSKMTGSGVTLINQNGKETWMTRDANTKFLKVMDFLHDHPDGYESGRKTGEKLDVSRTLIAHVKTYWEQNKDAFAEFREREAHQKAVDAGDEPPF